MQKQNCLFLKVDIRPYQKKFVQWGARLEDATEVPNIGMYLL
jgi:hypothetical protein